MYLRVPLVRTDLASFIELVVLAKASTDDSYALRIENFIQIESTHLRCNLFK